MSAEKKYTEREMVLAQREAFENGVGAMYCHECIPSGPSAFAKACAELTEDAQRRYPLPKVTRPRVVRDTYSTGFVDWRIVDEQFQAREDGSAEWRCMQHPGTSRLPSGASVAITPKRIALWADLLANPTEEVDEDDA